MLDLAFDQPVAPVYRGRRRQESTEVAPAVQPFPLALTGGSPTTYADHRSAPGAFGPPPDVIDLTALDAVIDLRDHARSVAGSLDAFRPRVAEDVAGASTAGSAEVATAPALTRVARRAAERAADAAREGAVAGPSILPRQGGRDAEAHRTSDSGRPVRGTSTRAAKARSGRPAGRIAARSGLFAAGAAGVAVLAAVAGQAVTGAAADAASGADDFSPTSSATSTFGQAPTVVDQAAAMTALQGGRATVPARVRATSRSTVRPVLPGCSGVVTTYDYPNGEVPKNELCALTFAPGHHLRADAAVALARLNIAYRATFGHNLCLTDSYRTLASQESLAARKPGLAATPGTSEHGFGLAVDFCDGVQRYDSAHYTWMRANAPAFGWNNPSWAIPPSAREEPWHWEYFPGEKGPAAADA